MKKMKCSSCGANLKIDENNEYATCPYCRSKYKVNEDVNVNFNFNMDDNMKEFIDKPFKRVNKGIKIYIIFFFIIFFAIAATFIVSFIDIIKSSNTPSSYDIASHNNSIKIYSGKQSKFFIETLLDNINETNKTDSIKVVIKYDNNEYTESEDIIMLKQMLEDKYYEIDFEYDKNGFINVCNILDIY